MVPHLPLPTLIIPPRLSALNCFCVKPGLKGGTSRLDFLLVTLACIERKPHAGLAHILLKRLDCNWRINVEWGRIEDLGPMGDTVALASAQWVFKSIASLPYLLFMEKMLCQLSISSYQNIAKPKGFKSQFHESIIVLCVEWLRWAVPTWSLHVVAMGEQLRLESLEGLNELDVQGGFFSHLSGIWAGFAGTAHDGQTSLFLASPCR